VSLRCDGYGCEFARREAVGHGFECAGLLGESKKRNGVVEDGREFVGQEFIKFAVTSNLSADPCMHRQPQHVNPNFTSSFQDPLSRIVHNL
jgi:hypothetical protein